MATGFKVAEGKLMTQFYDFKSCSSELTNGVVKKAKKRKKQGGHSLETLAKLRRSSELLAQVTSLPKLKTFEACCL